MCGLVGMVAARGAPPPNRERIERATQALSHRGPDGASGWFEESAGFGHTRLKIIDLERGDQPMWNEGRTLLTFFNGEIWNHAELREELERAGHVFRSRCDTEVLVHGFEEWGEELLPRLSGMFAFAIWDRQRERLLLARDRVGKKPLYLAETAAGVAFGSDARSVLLAADLKAELDHDRVPEYLFQRYVDAPRTLFRGVTKLRPGHLLTYDRDRVEQRPYWQLEPGQPAPLEPEELRELVQDSVRRRLMSDVPLGVLLSGGVDSTAVAGLMHSAGARDFATFTIGFSDPLYDERPWARLTAKRLGSDHHELEVDPRSFAEVLPRLSWYRDEPIAEPSEVPLLLLAELAGQHVKVVLTGDGGDEIFGGYPKYRAERILRGGGKAAALALRAAGTIAARRPSHRQLARAVETVAIDDPLLRWASWFRTFSAPELGRLLAPELRPTPQTLVEPLRGLLARYNGLDPTRKMLVGDFLTYLPDNMLLRGDKVLMAASLEGRMPLLDHRVIERVSNAPGSARAGLLSAKAVLRKAIEDVVPPEILRQPKRGFPVPVARVLLEDPNRSLERLLLSERTLARGLYDPAELRALVSGSNGYGTEPELKLFTAAMLELWLRTNVDELRLRPPETLDELLEPT
jgi:asparagine synthase (glutamine-hydrolysing)